MKPLFYRFPRILVFIMYVLTFNGTLLGQNGFHIYPYLQNPAPDAITVIWFSDVNTPGTLTYWKQGSETKTTLFSYPIIKNELTFSEWENKTYYNGQAPGAPFRHRLRIVNLISSTTYEYKVTQGGSTFSSSFRTVPEGNSAIRFIVYGDPETEPESTGSFTNWPNPGSNTARSYLIDQTSGYHQNLEIIRSRQPDIILIAGDLVESGGEQRDWDEFWIHNTNPDPEKSVAGKTPILAALGNHEYFEGPYLDQYNQPGSEQAVKRFLTYFESPQNNSPVATQEGRYYSITYGPATFIVLDVSNNGINKSMDDTNFYLLGESDSGGGNAPDFGPNSQQYKWLETKLIESQIKSLFTFIILHHSPYSSGPHGYPPGEVSHTDNQSGNPIRLLTPLFMKYGVDAVFSGHDEIWERSEIEGIEVKPDRKEVNHTIQFYDVGTGGDGLRGSEPDLVNQYQKFMAHKDSPEVWENNILKTGGKHYGHLEVNIVPSGEGSWSAIMDPVYILPRYNAISGIYSGYERQIYNDKVVLTCNEKDIPKPEDSLFSRSYPNPFSEETTIEYYLSVSCASKILIIGLNGDILKVLANANRDAGLYRISWDGRDDSGALMPSGLYFYRIETCTGMTESGRILLIR